MRTAVLIFLLLAGCAAQPQKVIVTQEFDQFGATECVVNDERFPLTDAERKRQIQQIVDQYCPVQ